MDDTKSNGKQWSPNGQMGRTPKAIPEIFLTRLLSTKGTIEKYVVDLFRTILTVNEHVPPAIIWLFKFPDEGARKQNVTYPLDDCVAIISQKDCIPEVKDIYFLNHCYINTEVEVKEIYTSSHM